MASGSDYQPPNAAESVMTLSLNELLGGEIDPLSGLLAQFKSVSLDVPPISKVSLGDLLRMWNVEYSRVPSASWDGQSEQSREPENFGMIEDRQFEKHMTKRQTTPTPERFEEFFVHEPPWMALKKVHIKKKSASMKVQSGRVTKTRRRKEGSSNWERASGPV